MPTTQQPRDATGDTAGDAAAGATPPTLAWADGRVLPASEATVPLLDEGFLRGDAVFEAMLVRGGRTHGLEPHLARMRRSAAALDLELPDVRAPIGALLRTYGPHDGALRIIATRAGTLRAIVGPAAWPATTTLGVVEMPWQTAVSGVKTLSYAANQWALRQARALGADDALIVDGGIAHELPTGTLVMVVDGALCSPSADELPILRSVTLETLREVAEVAGCRPSLAEVAAADELFVVSATRPGLPVRELVLPDGTRASYPAPGPITAEVTRQLLAHIDATLDATPADR